MCDFKAYPGSIAVKPDDAFHLEGKNGMVYSRAHAWAGPGGGLFLGYETRPAVSVLPLVVGEDGKYTGGWFLLAGREVEGRITKATGNYNNLDESETSSAIRSLRVKMGIVAEEKDLISVYPDCGIGRQFIFHVAGFVISKFTVDESANLPHSHERVFLTVEEMVRRTRKWELFGDDTYRLIMWVLMHNHYPAL